MTLADRVAIMKDGVILQLAPPEEIYNNPVNAYVAGFIGSPAMNLIPVSCAKGKVTAESGVEFKMDPPREGLLTLGVRAEDMQLCDAAQASFSSEIYAFECLGESTMITIKLGLTAVVIKADKNLRLKFGELINIKFNPNSLFWFDHNNGERVRQGALA